MSAIETGLLVAPEGIPCNTEETFPIGEAMRAMHAIWTMYKFRVLGFSASCLLAGHALTALLWGQGDRDMTAEGIKQGTLAWGWATSLALMFVAALIWCVKNGITSGDVPILDEMAAERWKRHGRNQEMWGTDNDLPPATNNDFFIC